MSHHIKQERQLRISKSVAIPLCVYLLEENVDWFTDAVFQETLQAIKPSLQEKIDECKRGLKRANLFKNSGMQVAYFVVQAQGDTLGQILVQNPAIKAEDGSKNNHIYTYTALHLLGYTLVVIPEPYDPNNQIFIPGVFGKVEIL